MEKYCIYRITNCINGKTYIGQHKYKDTPYDNYMGSGKLLHRAYDKYGIENFVKGIIIDNIEDQDIIDQLEKDYIAFEKQHNPNGCYNIASGGRGCDVCKGRPSPKKGKKFGPRSEEIRRKLSESHMGIPGSNKGKHWKLVDGKRVWY